MSMWMSAEAEPQAGWSGSCNVLLQNLLRDMRTPLQREATLSLLDSMSSRCLPACLCQLSSAPCCPDLENVHEWTSLVLA